MALFLVILIIVVALVFDFINGFHDSANSIATVVSTRVLSPRLAVIWAAFFNFIAAFGFGVSVAKTIGKGVIKPEAVNEYVILSGLIGAIAWDLVTWYYGLPSSSSHALIGGFAGSALSSTGTASLIPAGLYKVTIFIFISPVIGLFLGFLNMLIVSWIFKNSMPSKVDRWFR